MVSVFKMAGGAVAIVAGGKTHFSGVGDIVFRNMAFANALGVGG
jgi:hypothetical protein